MTVTDFVMGRDGTGISGDGGVAKGGGGVSGVVGVDMSRFMVKIFQNMRIQCEALLEIRFRITTTDWLWTGRYRYQR